MQLAAGWTEPCWLHAAAPLVPHSATCAPGARMGMGLSARLRLSLPETERQELCLQCSSFSYRLLAALPSVIKIYQCEPKHLALHLLL